MTTASLPLVKCWELYESEKGWKAVERKLNTALNTLDTILGTVET